MAHGKLYNKLINCKRWRELRTRKLYANPLCELHKKNGKIVAASVVHHIIEVESGVTEDDCIRLAYSWNNLQSLCKDCHSQIHQERKSHSKQVHTEREKSRLQQWISNLNVRL